MWCLTLATNAVVTWTTEYHGLAVTALRRAGRHIDDAVLAHIWPTHHENVHFYGSLASPSLLLILRDYPQLRGVGAQIRRCQQGVAIRGLRRPGPCVGGWALQ
jgi:Tn3 transposase DDE domain